MELTRRRLVAHEAEHLRLGVPRVRRTELETLIVRNVDVLVEAYKKLAKMIERMPAA